MIEVKYNKIIFPIKSIWFVRNNEIKPSLLTIIHDHSEQIKNSKSQIHYTLISNLEESNDEILSKFKKNYRYEIRRANNQDGFEYKRFRGLEIKKHLKHFSKEYDKFCKMKGIKNTLNKKLIKKMMERNSIILTQAVFKGVVLSHHMYILDSYESRLLYSVSNFRKFEDKQVVGRSNKWLHLQDMYWLKKNKIKLLDWGGISSIETPNGIDNFKMGFGGTVEKKYLIITSKYILIRKLLGVK